MALTCRWRSRPQPSRAEVVSLIPSPRQRREEKMRLVLLRKAPPCPPFLRRTHPGSPSQRPGLHHTHLAHIGTERCAIDMRRFAPGCLTRILVNVIRLGRRRTPGSDEDQHEQCSFHPGLSSKSRRCVHANCVRLEFSDLACACGRLARSTAEHTLRVKNFIGWWFRSGRRNLGVPLSPGRGNAFGSPNTSPATPVSAAAAKQQQ